MKLYGFAYTRAALSALEKIPKKSRQQIRKKVELLSDNPATKGVKIVRGVMDGENNVYRVRSGDYRILYTIRDGPQIVVLDIGHRKDIYR